MTSTLAGADEAVAVLRLRRGVVGETRRVCHVVPVPMEGAVPEYLTALCGEQILPGQAELLDGISGMPCVSCLARTRTGGSSGLEIGCR